LGLWLLFTSTMVAWWWFYGLGQLTHLPQSSLSPQDMIEIDRRHRMIMWEGISFLSSIFIGAISLLVYIRRDQKRHEQLKLFFSTFTHDLKTSIARLRLQSDVLREDAALAKSPQLQRLAKDINRLDLQLENSLLMSRHEEEGFLLQDQKISQAISEIRSEWDDLQIELKSDAIIKVDRRALLAILRNVFHNSVLHGKATALVITPSAISNGQVKVSIQDNGAGTKLDLSSLGKSILSHDQKSSHGLGLYLIRQLTEQMKGSVKFRSSSEGFCVELEFKGGSK
jgi:signal transduction histidine kinase